MEKYNFPKWIKLGLITVAVSLFTVSYALALNLEQNPYPQNVQKTGTTCSAVITWETDYATTSSSVFYSASVTGPWVEVKGTCPGTYTKAINPEIQLTNLTPNAKYYYYVRSQDSGGASVQSDSNNPRSFRTTRDRTSSFKFAVYGDTQGDIFDGGVSSNATTLANQIDSLDVDFILHAGDFTYQATWTQWDNFLRSAQPYLKEATIYPAIGNHDTDSDPNLQNYKKFFALPDNGSGDPYLVEQWYAFEYGNCYIISLN